MAFSSKSKLQGATRKVETTEGTLSTPADPTPLEKSRHDIQQKFVGYKLERKITQRELSERLGIDEGKVSKILHNQVNEFSTDCLNTFYGNLNPAVKLKVS